MAGKRRKRYNILYTTSFASMMGGGQWSLYYLIKHLDKDIFHPIVLCPQEGELADRMRGAGAEVICLDVGRIRYLNPFIIMQFISLIKERKITLVHTDSTTETFYAGIAAKMMRVPLIWHIRVSEEERFLDKFLALLATRLILVAKAIESRFDWLKGTQKMVVIYNGIDLEEFDNFPATSSVREEFNINKETVLLGCIGRIEKRKGQEYLISAMRHIDNAKLILVGREDEGYTRRIKNLCEEFGISDRVIFAGYRDDIPAVLREIDILVFPTITGEGFSRVILEAMAAKKAVIATDNAGNPEAVADGVTGYIVPTKNTALLAEKINELVLSQKKRTTMGKEAGRKRVEEFFTIQQHADKIKNLYLEICKGKRKQERDKITCLLCDRSYSTVIEHCEDGYQVRKCSVCGLVYVDPIPPQELIEKAYSEEYYTPWLETQRKKRIRMWKWRLEKINTFTGRKGNLLDVGCAEGLFLELARKDGWEVTGTEISPFAVKYGQERLNLNICPGELMDIGFPDKTFDAVTMWHVLEHTTNPLIVLKEIRRILKDDGVLILAIPNFNNIFSQWAYRLVKGKKIHLFNPLDRELHIYHFTPDTIRLTLGKANFKVKKIIPDMGITQWQIRNLNYFAKIFGFLIGNIITDAIEVYATKS